jgi:hypothetical protein
VEDVNVKLVVVPARTEIQDGLMLLAPGPEDTETVNESLPPPEHALTNAISGARRQIERGLAVGKVIDALRQGIKILLKIVKFYADGQEQTGTLAFNKRADHRPLAPAASILNN